MVPEHRLVVVSKEMTMGMAMAMVMVTAMVLEVVMATMRRVTSLGKEKASSSRPFSKYSRYGHISAKLVVMAAMMDNVS